MIEIKESGTHIFQMKDDFKMAEVKKADIIDFGVDMRQGLKILFTVKGKHNVAGLVTMHFCNSEQFDRAIERVIFITDKMGI